jgi:hypothetical protein
MRFILQEYLNSLKEDGELDAFLKRLIISMKYRPLTTTQKGRQYGVDLPAVGKDEDGVENLFLFVIKQGNFSRKNWDSGSNNDIRASINEILDAYISTRIPKPYDELPIKIVVCCNGEMEQPIEQNWAQFVNKHTVQRKISFDFWGLFHLVEKTEQFQVNEDLMTPNLALNFRRALAFIDLPDYDLAHMNVFLSQLLPTKEPKALNDREAQRKIRLANLSMSIVHNWCRASNNIKPSYVVAERIVLVSFNWMIGNNLAGKQSLLCEYYTLIQNWKTINYDYINKTGQFLTVEESLSLGVGHFNEYCLITFEQLGIISMMGLLEVWEFYIANSLSTENTDDRVQTAFDNAVVFANILAQVIDKNPSSLNPRYDEQCIEINMGMILLVETGLFGVAKSWLCQLIDRLILNVKMARFFPLDHSNPEKLEVEKSSNQKASVLGPMLLEWCIVLKQFDYYRELKAFLKNELPNLNLQLWFPDEETEKFMFFSDASAQSGCALISINFPDKPEEAQMFMAEEQVLLNEEQEFKFNKAGLSFLPFLSSRHFRTYPFPNSWRVYMSSNFCFNVPENA